MPVAIHDDESDLVKITPPHSVAVDNSSFPLPTMDEKPKLDFLDKEADLIKREAQESKVDVQGMVDETVRRVREQSDRLQAAAQPYASKTRDFAETKPVLFTFLAIFTALSIVPVGFFIGFLVSATVFILGFAAIGICLSCLGVILFSASILLPILLFTSVVSLFAVTSLLSLFLAHRLYLHVRASTTTPTGETLANYDSLALGVKAWVDETKTRAGFEVLPKPKSPSQGYKAMPAEAGARDLGADKGEKVKVRWEDGAWVGLHTEDKKQ